VNFAANISHRSDADYLYHYDAAGAVSGEPVCEPLYQLPEYVYHLYVLVLLLRRPCTGSYGLSNVETLLGGATVNPITSSGQFTARSFSTHRPPAMKMIALQKPAIIKLSIGIDIKA
jgi:hypothetical protein